MQVGGVPVGSVTNIELTPDYKAVITIHVDSSLVPLHHGTTAQVRVPSLTSVANRYVALTPGPNSNPVYPAGATLPASVTGEVTDLDQLFNTLNPKTRKGLQGFIQGTAEQYVGQGKNLGTSVEYFAPALSATHALLLRAHPRPADLHELPRGNGEGGDDDRRAPGIARGPDRKPEQDVPGDRLRAERARARPETAAGDAAPGQPHVRRTPGDVRRAERARQGIQADDEVADDAARTPAPAGDHGDAGGGATSARRSAAPAPTTTSPTSCARSPGSPSS